MWINVTFHLYLRTNREVAVFFFVSEGVSLFWDHGKFQVKALNSSECILREMHLCCYCL
jgi:hypothetical protein